MTARALLLAGLLIAAGTPSTMAAQNRRWFQGELRADAIAARASTAQVAAAVSTPLGTYLRGALAVGAGPSWRGGQSSVSTRVDATGRFVLDPFRQYRWTPYGLAGASLLYDEFEEWRPLLVIALGVEGPERRGVVPAFEVGLGGGLRIGAAVRKAIRERR